MIYYNEMSEDIVEVQSLSHAVWILIALAFNWRMS